MTTVIDAMNEDHIMQCWFRFLHVLSNPVDLSRPHVIANTQQFLQATLTSGDVPSVHQAECLRQLPTVFYRAMRCIATIVDAFLGNFLYSYRLFLLYNCQIPGNLMHCCHIVLCVYSSAYDVSTFKIVHL